MPYRGNNTDATRITYGTVYILINLRRLHWAFSICKTDENTAVVRKMNRIMLRNILMWKQLYPEHAVFRKTCHGPEKRHKSKHFVSSTFFYHNITHQTKLNVRNTTTFIYLFLQKSSVWNQPKSGVSLFWDIMDIDRGNKILTFKPFMEAMFTRNLMLILRGF